MRAVNLDTVEARAFRALRRRDEIAGELFDLGEAQFACACLGVR